jgi:hypothetical protein
MMAFPSRKALNRPVRRSERSPRAAPPARRSLAIGPAAVCIAPHGAWSPGRPDDEWVQGSEPARLIAPSWALEQSILAMRHWRSMHSRETEGDSSVACQGGGLARALRLACGADSVSHDSPTRYQTYPPRSHTRATSPGGLGRSMLKAMVKRRRGPTESAGSTETWCRLR